MNIQTRATKVAKISKEEAASLVESMYLGRVYSAEQLAQLYKYFLPPMPKIAKTDVAWVAKAVSTSDSRTYLNHVYSDGENVVATDGCAMFYTGTCLPEGFYDARGNRIEFDGRFPDYKRIIPKMEVFESVDFSTLPVEKFGRKASDLAYVMPSGRWVAKKYIDAFLNGDNTAILLSKSESETDPLFLQRGAFFGVIMQVRPKPKEKA